jgi:SAM-dependent methyltransferase
MTDMATDTQLYTTNEYIHHFPSMHREDSPWKLEKLRPLLDEAARRLGSVVTVLDVGGGAGEILAGAAEHLRRTHGREVVKYAIDLTPAMLQEQARTNPDLRRSMLEDVRWTSLADKEADLTLMIDVLEHVPDPEVALREIRRTSRYAIFKVPLEDNLYDRVCDLRRRGELRWQRLEQIGHVNVYRYATLRQQIERHLGPVVRAEFTNAAAYHLSQPATRAAMGSREFLMNRFAATLNRISGRIGSRIFCDFVMVLAECR